MRISHLGKEYDCILFWKAVKLKAIAHSFSVLMESRKKRISDSASPSTGEFYKDTSASIFSCRTTHIFLLQEERHSYSKRENSALQLWSQKLSSCEHFLLGSSFWPVPSTYPYLSMPTLISVPCRGGSWGSLPDMSKT